MKLRKPSVLFQGVAILCSLTLAGCSSDDDSDSSGLTGDTADSSTTGNAGTAEGSGEAGMNLPADDDASGESSPTTLDGSWLKGCTLSDADFPEDGFDVVLLTFSGASFTSRMTNYEDETCQVPAVPGQQPAEQLFTGSVVYPGGTAETASGMATNVDLTIESIEDDGEVPDEMELQLLITFGFFDTTYTIALVRGSELFLGDNLADAALDGTTTERRPNTFMATPFLRQ